MEFLNTHDLLDEINDLNETIDNLEVELADIKKVKSDLEDEVVELKETIEDLIELNHILETNLVKTEK